MKPNVAPFAAPVWGVTTRDPRYDERRALFAKHREELLQLLNYRATQDGWLLADCVGFIALMGKTPDWVTVFRREKALEVLQRGNQPNAEIIRKAVEAPRAPATFIVLVVDSAQGCEVFTLPMALRSKGGDA